MDFFTGNRELKFNNHYYEESEESFEKSRPPFLQSFLEYFKLSGIFKCLSAILELNCVCERFGDWKKKHGKFVVKCNVMDELSCEM